MGKSIREISRVLGPGDVSAALAVIGLDPVVNVFADYRTRITQLDTRWLGGEMWGYVEDDELISLCHIGANLVPVNATPAACEAFAERAARSGRKTPRSSGPRMRWLTCGTGSRTPGRPRETRAGTSPTWSPDSRPPSSATPRCAVRRRS